MVRAAFRRFWKRKTPISLPHLALVELVRPLPATPMTFDGERYTTALGGTIEQEHVHRYLFAASYCAGRAVLDIACGEGYGSALLAGTASTVIGVDVSEAAVAHANASYRLPGLEFRVGTCEAIPLPDAAVDVVVSFETIEHIEAHARFMDEIRRVLRPGGTAIISTPDHQVYSIENGVQNTWHVRELHQAEFYDLLRSRFAHAGLLGQKSTAGSLIAPLAGSEPHPVEIAHRRDTTRYAIGSYMIGAPFLIGVASDNPVGILPVSIMDDPGFIPRLEQLIIPELQRRIKDLEQKLHL